MGLIVNPLAGIGGRVGLKGSDGLQIQQKALALGAVPEAHSRALRALLALKPLQPRLEVLCAPAEMGENAARQCGFILSVLGEAKIGVTTAEDTCAAAHLIRQAGVDLLLFAGGDGTARDIYRAVGNELPVLGIPAGVKIHSPVFATNPHTAGEIALAFLQGNNCRLHEAEVIDLDEDAYRAGIVATRLFGVLSIPYQRNLLQNAKVPSPMSESVAAEAIAWEVVESMQAGWLYVLGPGTTTRAVANRLGMSKTLVGVDVISRERLVASDANEDLLLELAERQPARIIVTPTGGQGYLFGRGNQPISPRLIQKLGKANIQVISTIDKLNRLGGRPLLVDSGDPAVDALLSGHIQVVTGYHERVVYRVST
jgi:predicted polyphosphate/ATP-dependent NAD kinase